MLAGALPVSKPSRDRNKPTHDQSRVPNDLSCVPDPSDAVPIIELPRESDMRRKHGIALVAALGHTGFVRIRAPGALSQGCAEAALEACAELLSCSVGGMVLDAVPKKREKGSKEFAMLRPEHVARDSRLHSLQGAFCDVKRRVLLGLELGLGLAPTSLVGRHTDDSDALRLLRYPPGQKYEGPKNTERCYEHMDYGSITLLLQDMPGLEVRHEASGVWIPVGSGVGSDGSADGGQVSEDVLIAVNIGKKLAESPEAAGRLPLAWHRVPGPHSANSLLSADQLAVEATYERHSIAYFVQEQQYHDSAGRGIHPPSDNTPTRYARGATRGPTYEERNRCRTTEARQTSASSTPPQLQG